MTYLDTLLFHLTLHPYSTLQSLCQEFSVTPRTMENYIHLLRDFAPVATIRWKGRPTMYVIQEPPC